MPSSDERRREPDLRQAAVGERAHHPEHHLDRGERVLRQVERERDRARWRWLETARPARISVTGPPCAPASATTASMATAAPASPPSGSASANAGAQAQMDRQHRAQRRPARDADQARLGQRIAQIALQRRARQPERAAHQRAQNGARQADLPEDEGAGLAPQAEPEARRTRWRARGETPRRPAPPARSSRRTGACPGRAARLGRHRPRASMRARASASRSTASTTCGVPHSQCRHGSSIDAPPLAQETKRGMAQIVGQRRAVLLRAARQHQQVRRIGQQHLERHLAAAGEAIVAPPCCESRRRQAPHRPGCRDPRPCRRPDR